MLKAVIFDMDGTLLDTERVSQTTWRRVASERGVTIPDAMLHAFVGCSIPNARRMMDEEFGDPALTQCLIDAHHDRFLDVAKTELQPMPGAREAVEGLKADGYLVALATSTERQYAELELGKFDMLSLFDATVFGDEIERAKPEPDIYQEAARRLGVDPTECAAVEDSFNGIRSAFRAGTQVFMVPDWNQPTEEIAAMCCGVLPSLHELRAAVEREAAAVAAMAAEGAAPAIEAVIYDMDGTLVDSERVSGIAWEETLKLMGASVEDARPMLRSFIGRSAPSVEGELATFLGSAERAHEAFQLHTECFDKIAEKSLELKPAARESIDRLRATGCKIALATSTLRPRALARLERFGLQDAFDAIATGDEIKNGKPAPDIFLLAAERLGVMPAACAVAEDSFNGVRSGHAAGMHVFMVPDLVAPTPEIADRCEAVLSNLAELPQAVATVQ